MKFGTYFAYWEQEWAADYAHYCHKAADAGFDVLEISAAGFTHAPDDELKRIKNAARKAGVELTSCIGLSSKQDVSSSDEAVRRSGIEFLKQALRNMDKLDSRVLGGIIYAYWPADYTKPIDKAAARAKSIESVQEVSLEAEKYGIKLMLETVNRFEHYIINDAAEAVALVKDIGKPNVYVMLDSFHMNIEEDSMYDAIVHAGKHLGHFHIGECNRKVPGKGHMDWDGIGRGLRDIGYSGAVVMEPFVRMGGTVGSEIKVWRDLSGNATDAELDRDIAQSLRFVKDKFLRG